RVRARAEVPQSCARSAAQPVLSGWSPRGGEEEAAAGRATARARDRGLRVLDLTFASLTAQLRDRLVDEAVAVEPSRRELPAVRVERQDPVTSDVGAAREEVLRLTRGAEPEGLDPRQAVEGEAVVELGHVDVRRREIGAGPEVRGRSGHQ